MQKRAIETTEFMADYYSILQELDPELREIILHVYDRNGNLGLTYKEISDILGIKQGNVGKKKILECNLYLMNTIKRRKYGTKRI